MAAHFTPAELWRYDGRQIIGVEVYITASDGRGITVSIYTSGTSTPGGVPIEKYGIVRRGWRTVYLDAPVTINGSGDLWVAYRMDTAYPVLTPIGTDTGYPNDNGHFWRAYSGGSGTWSSSLRSTNYIIRAVLAD